jgi:multicomponent Na+:H+ antiporter subunit B
MPVMLLFSILLLFRGHHEPGGGFVGGLMAAAAFCLNAIAYDVWKAQRAIHIDPRRLIGLGLLIALSSGLVSLFLGAPFMTGVWHTVALPLIGEVELGTPLLFDTGVYFVVLGVTTLIVFSLMQEDYRGT